MRAIITGGAGFIGSYICEEIVAKGGEILVIDNLFRGKIENVDKIINIKKQLIILDLADVKNIEKIGSIILKFKPTHIFHYAAINGTQYFYDMPGEVVTVNSIVTYVILSSIKFALAIDNNIKPLIIYASTSEVYGEPTIIPTPESAQTYVRIDQNRDSYAVAKLVGEFYIKMLCKEMNLDYYILRLFNVYGPRMIGTKYGQVIPEFIQRLSSGEYPLCLFGNGNHTRAFCFISDNVRVTMEVINKCPKNNVYNIGNPVETTIKDLAFLIMKILGIEPKIKILPEREGDHHRRIPSINKIKIYLGDIEFISLEAGIKLMITMKK